MKKILFLIMLVVLVTGCSMSNLFVRENNEANNYSFEILSGIHNVEMKVKNYGTIKLELDADVAPITVSNFINLVNNKFYDGLTFHRIIDGFMVQGGDPNHNGTGGSEESIKGEFSINGYNNTISHKRGVISMARAGSNPETSKTMNSATSQFFICHADSEFLDGKYAAFGHVISGMDVVDKLAKVEVIDDNGTVELEKQPVIEYIKVIVGE